MGIVQLFLWPCSMVFCMLTRGLMKIEGVLQVYPWKTTGFYDDRWYTSHRPKPIFTKRTLLIVISKIVIYQYLPNLSDLWTWSYFYIHHFFYILLSSQQFSEVPLEEFLCGAIRHVRGPKSGAGFRCCGWVGHPPGMAIGATYHISG